VAGSLSDAKITSQDDYKAFAYSSGHVEFHGLSPDDSAQCLDSGHRSRERAHVESGSGTETCVSDRSSTEMTSIPPCIPLWVNALKTPSYLPYITDLLII